MNRVRDLLENSHFRVLSLASLVGAILIGVGGARGLTSEVDKNLLRVAAAAAAEAQPPAAAFQQIELAAPAQALNVTKRMMYVRSLWVRNPRFQLIILTPQICFPPLTWLSP